jgi:2,3-bisphosphoglycerate-dependent phosphoglycerate mutase
MFKTASIFLLSFFLISCGTATSFYVVRHAEKEAPTPNMTTDVPLSAAGAQRAEALRELLKSKKIERIYSTGYQRTKNTAQPLSSVIGIPITVYNPTDTGFVRSIKNLKGNTLIVGHSNTVDDIVNGLLGSKELSDLPDSQYGDVWILKRKGSKWTMEKAHFGN